MTVAVHGAITVKPKSLQFSVLPILQLLHWELGGGELGRFHACEDHIKCGLCLHVSLGPIRSQSDHKGKHWQD